MVYIPDKVDEKFWEKYKLNLKLGKYKLSVQDYERMLRIQDYRCKICGDEFKNPKHICIDHDHKTGRIRGILCTWCNSGLGFFKDEPNRLLKAATYLMTLKSRRNI